MSDKETSGSTGAAVTVGDSTAITEGRYQLVRMDEGYDESGPLALVDGKPLFVVYKGYTRYISYGGRIFGTGYARVDLTQVYLTSDGGLVIGVEEPVGSIYLIDESGKKVESSEGLERIDIRSQEPGAGEIGCEVKIDDVTRKYRLVCNGKQIGGEYNFIYGEAVREVNGKYVFRAEVEAASPSGMTSEKDAGVIVYDGVELGKGIACGAHGGGIVYQGSYIFDGCDHVYKVVET